MDSGHSSLTVHWALNHNWERSLSDKLCVLLLLTTLLLPLILLRLSKNIEIYNDQIIIACVQLSLGVKPKPTEGPSCYSLFLLVSFVCCVSLVWTFALLFVYLFHRCFCFSWLVHQVSLVCFDWAPPLTPAQCLQLVGFLYFGLLLSLFIRLLWAKGFDEGMQQSLLRAFLFVCCCRSPSLWALFVFLFTILIGYFVSLGRLICYFASPHFRPYLIIVFLCAVLIYYKKNAVWYRAF